MEPPPESPEKNACPAAPLLLNLDGHVHDAGCGHALVEHDDHYDYIGDDGVLHHLLASPSCCPEHSSRGNVWVSHGSHADHPATSSRTIKANVCQGPGCLASCCVAGKDYQNQSARHGFGLYAPNIDSSGLLSDACVTKIYAEGICCPMEVPVIEAALGRLPGIASVEVAVVTKTVTVKHVPALTSPGAMVAALNEARLEASLTFPRKAVRGKASWVPPWHVLLASVLAIISLLHYLAGPTDAEWLDAFKWVGLGAVALALPSIALKALGALRHLVFDIHLLITIAAAGAIAIGDYSEAATVVVLFAIADFLESRCTGQARDAIAAVLALKPETAVLVSTGNEVNAASVPVGSRILVRAGEKVPLDGVIESGSSTFDESVLTGESVPVSKGAGDSVQAGCLNSGSGLVTVRTTVSADSTFIAGMARLVEEATSRQSPAEAMVARFAKVYTPLVVLGCLLLAFVPWSNPDADRKAWVYLSLQVLVTACPCALVLSTPVTVVSALARAAHAGVLIRGGVVLETLADVRVVSFDKTGTLTRGAFMICDVIITEHGPANEKEVLRLLGSLERGSSHPLAAAVVGRAAARGVDCNATVSNFSLVPGFGIEGTVDGRPVAAGTAQYLCERGLAGDPALNDDDSRCRDRGLSVCFVEIDGKYAACIAARDTMRQEASEAVLQLRALGTTPAMLTGDNASVATTVAGDAGIHPLHVHAALLPEDKLETVAAYRRGEIPLETHHGGAGVIGVVRDLREKGLGLVQRRKKFRHRVAHVGDGVNDAPALAAADVGIAMGVAGAAAALEAGDVALFTNDLRVVPALQRLARAAGRKIVFNITLSIVTKVVVLVLATMQRFTLWGAVLVDVGTALLVTLNGLTLLRWDFGVPGGPVLCIGEEAAKPCCNSDCSARKSCCGPTSHTSTAKGAKSCCSGSHCSDNKPCCDAPKPTFAACCDAGAEAQTHCGNTGEHMHTHSHGCSDGPLKQYDPSHGHHPSCGHSHDSHKYAHGHHGHDDEEKQHPQPHHHVHHHDDYHDCHHDPGSLHLENKSFREPHHSGHAHHHDEH